MAQIRALLKQIFGSGAEQVPPEGPLDYEKVVHLDAENLAEQGIKAAYDDLLQQLQHYAPNPLDVTEEVSSDAGSYTVIAAGNRYEIWGPTVDSDDDWARAAVAFFQIVNANLGQSSHKFYALYGGNDLSGLFLTNEQCLLAQKAIKNPSSRPYMPVMEPPHYGFPAQGST
ncbi:hypothetical protein [Comamonas odontotermitis]|uniref:hypothetical protein n=1 Tax=Comamonas odontotermitis TaxID=379895 RepID=UPI003750A4D4